ncbi:MAG TPA: Pr6Pr family membrane protein [Devosiaceae bacterium]|jgi:hypothetical protein
MSAGRALTLLGFGVGGVGLILQFSISIPAYLANGRSLGDALVTYFSYFTILTNLTLVLIYLADLVAVRGLSWFRSPVTRAMMAGVMVLVMLFYHFLLAQLSLPQGLFLLCSVTLHYVTPILYALWWGLVARHGEVVGWRDTPKMMLPPLVYVVYAMLRGAIVGEYPYPILEANRLGYPQAIANIVIVAITLTVLFVFVIAIDRYLARTSPSRTTA